MRPTPAKVGGGKAGKPGKAKEFTGRERTGAGSFEEKGEAMFKGKSQILRDNRGA